MATNGGFWSLKLSMSPSSLQDALDEDLDIWMSSDHSPVDTQTSVGTSTSQVVCEVPVVEPVAERRRAARRTRTFVAHRTTPYARRRLEYGMEREE